ncbi:hypothetical protein JQN64_26620, partial [Escherichia coli]|nr:hypothetical protein [Escherichia coli]
PIRLPLVWWSCHSRFLLKLELVRSVDHFVASQGRRYVGTRCYSLFTLISFQFTHKSFSSFGEDYSGEGEPFIKN